MRGKPIIAIANSHTEFNPGHTHLRAVAQREIIADAVETYVRSQLFDTVLEQRRKVWQPVQKPVPPGYMNRYRKLVSSAAKGAVLS
jgi:dihydroxyacid dehydratase/phosphogluconate dehydratase